MKISSSTVVTMTVPKLTDSSHAKLGYQVRLDDQIGILAYVTADEADEIAIGWARVATAIREREAAEQPVAS